MKTKRSAYLYLGLMLGLLTGILIRAYEPSPVGAGSPQPAPFTILEVEEKLNCEILHPTIRELQEHINRHGGLKGTFIKVDGWYETETKDGANWVRCNQEASRMFKRMAGVKE